MGVGLIRYIYLGVVGEFTVPSYLSHIKDVCCHLMIAGLFLKLILDFA